MDQQGATPSDIELTSKMDCGTANINAEELSEVEGSIQSGNDVISQSDKLNVDSLEPTMPPTPAPISDEQNQKVSEAELEEIWQLACPDGACHRKRISAEEGATQSMPGTEGAVDSSIMDVKPRKNNRGVKTKGGKKTKTGPVLKEMLDDLKLQMLCGKGPYVALGVIEHEDGLLETHTGPFGEALKAEGVARVRVTAELAGFQLTPVLSVDWKLSKFLLRL